MSLELGAGAAPQLTGLALNGAMTALTHWTQMTAFSPTHFCGTMSLDNGDMIFNLNHQRDCLGKQSVNVCTDESSTLQLCHALSDECLRVTIGSVP